MPVFPSDPKRNDDGHTLLCVGIIRPYKGIADAIERQTGMWTELGSSSPATRWSRWTRTASRRATAPSGASRTCPRARMTAALGDATVALFPYRPEIDQSAALLRALGAGCPSSPTTSARSVGGSALGAGRVVPAGDDALTEAARELLDDPRAGGGPSRPTARDRSSRGSSRAGAPRAVQGAAVTRFSDVISRQLELFQREQAALIEDCDTAELKYDQAGRDDAEKYAGLPRPRRDRDKGARGVRDNFASAMDEESAESTSRVQPRRGLRYRASRWRSDATGASSRHRHHRLRLPPPPSRPPPPKSPPPPESEPPPPMWSPLQP